MELEQQEISSASPEQKKESGKDEPTASPEKTDTVQQQYKSQPMSHHNPAVMATVTRLLYHMGRIFRDNGMAPANPLGLRMDSKRRKKLMAKRLALGHKADDHEEQNWQNGPSM